MKQVIQSRRSGRLSLKEVPAPKVKAGHVLVRTRASLISAGTERMVVDFAKKSLAGKARARPDLVKKVVDKAKRDGLKATFQTVMARLDEPLPLGYSAAGEVVAVGAGLEGRFRVGERVAMAGAGIANHAELNAVPENLLAAIPDGVTDEDASFGTLGAIALHAVRNTGAGLGDVVCVLGCGLVGQLAAQFLTLAGARAVVMDYDPERLDLARSLGAEAAVDLGGGDGEAAVGAITRGRGCDAVIIAAATSSSEPFETAAAVARDRARVVMVGLTGTAFPYAEFMKKELNIVVSRSYGPGRYDAEFEGRGVKYPEGWVRWTETENLAETLRLLAPGPPRRLNVAALVTHRFPLIEAAAAYGLIGGGERHLGVLLTYPEGETKVISPNFQPASGTGAGCVLGVIGAGNFARAVLLPELKRLDGVHFHTLATERGASAGHGQETFGFERASADAEDVLSAPEINAVLVATRHDSHAALTARALEAGKAVLVEKPLALDWDQLNGVIEARNGQDGRGGAFFQVGFNRRFAPAAQRLAGALGAKSGPKVVLLRVNAGAIDDDHWIQGPEGGGRLLGEACHFIDLARYLVGAPIDAVQAEAAAADGACDDAAISLRFADGSLANLLYTAQGDGAAGKEMIEAHAGGASYVIEDFRSFEVHGDAATAPWKGSQDKGFRGALKAFTGAVAGGATAPIDEAELIETSAATLAVLESLRTGERIEL
ncbi:MAG: bi-domain-containing oxidoreductase [Magnetovibrio sp.]|nr:bi-domain-containing oxidoreductase [Magnetovibrio sp.]